VTTAENGLRALEYLGLGDPQQTDSLTNVSSIFPMKHSDWFGEETFV